MTLRFIPRLAVTLLLSLAVLAARPAMAQIDFGVRAGIFGSDPVLGGELLIPLEDAAWTLNPNIEVVFVDNGDLFVLNGDVLYELDTGADLDFWLGGGLAALFRDFDNRGRGDDGDTDIGVNVLGRLAFGQTRALRPFVQGKLVLADDSEASLVLGLRF